ncbi:MAG: Gfo/Idh/MocA family oxidoreductase [Cyanobacteria bacterium P01_C01_bin.69]
MTQTLSPQTPIDLILFGAGRWGTHLLRNLSAHPQVRLRAVVEASPKRLQTLSKELDSSIELLSNWQTAITLESVEACVIATPAATHYNLIEAALKQGLHVLAEKPLTLNTKKSQTLCDLAFASNKQLVIDHTYLFHGAVAAGKSAIPSIGSPRYGYATRTHLGPVRRDVDALWDLAIHDISIFNHWLDESPVQVQAQSRSWLQPNITTPLSPNGLADVVWCRLQYPSGFQATIHLCWANPDKQRRLCVVGDQGTLIFDEMNPAAPLTKHCGDFAEEHGWFTPQNLATETLSIPKTEPLKNVCEHFITCIRQNNPSAVSSGQVGTDLVAVLTALSASMDAGEKWVTVAY